MTPQEAIKILKPLFEHCKGKNECLGYIEHFFTKDEEEALEMAIKALEQQSSEDCISREAVKDMLTAEWTKYMPMESDVSLSFVLEKISELPSVTPKARWIPVSERLPEICREAVLTTQIYGDGYAYVGVDEYTTNNGGRWLMEVPFDNPEECCKVIAWMPLPQPYKEVEAND